MNCLYFFVEEKSPANHDNTPPCWTSRAFAGGAIAFDTLPSFDYLTLYQSDRHNISDF